MISRRDAQRMLNKLAGGADEPQMTISREDAKKMYDLLKEKIEEKPYDASTMERPDDVYLEEECPRDFAPCDPLVQNCPEDHLGTNMINKTGQRCFPKGAIERAYRGTALSSKQRKLAQATNLAIALARLRRSWANIADASSQSSSGSGKNTRFTVTADQICGSIDTKRFCGTMPWGQKQIECAWQGDTCTATSVEDNILAPTSTGSASADSGSTNAGDSPSASAGVPSATARVSADGNTLEEADSLEEIAAALRK